FVDHRGNFVIPPRYPVETTDNPHWNIKPHGYKEGFALVEWFPFCRSFINKSGELAFNSKELQQLNMHEVHSFHDGFAFVPFQEWNKWNGYGYIDLKGNVLGLLGEFA
ncbi:MAG: WG repeat-containing protein, partial [Terriglobales bacterium]